MTVTITGLSSGLDTTAIMDAFMTSANVPLAHIQSEQADITTAQNDLSSFMLKMTALRAATSTLADRLSYASVTATSSDTGVSASVATGAVPGSFSAQVLSLANEQRVKSDAQSSNTDSLGQTGTLSLQVGSGSPVSLDVGVDDSLVDIANDINEAGLRVTASVVYDGSEYRLLVRGLDSGADNAVTITENGTSLGLDNTQSPVTTFQAKSRPQFSNGGALDQAGTLNIQVGTDAAVPINVVATDSLDVIADTINNSGARVTASVQCDGSRYRLLVQSLDAGAANTLTFTETGTSLGLAVTASPATDALARIDGAMVTSSTNVVRSAIPGATLTLKSEMSSPGTITIASDPAALASKINTFVSAYNDVVNTAHTLAGYGTNAGSNPLLQSDSSIRTTLDRLARIISAEVPGSSGRYMSLSSVGLSSNSDGTLKLNQVKLSTAVAEDPTGVARLFTTDPSIGATGAMGTLNTTIDALTDTMTGTLTQRQDVFGRRQTSLQDQATLLQTRLATYQKALQSQFTQLEKNMNAIKAKYSAYQTLFNAGTSSSSSSSSSSSIFGSSSGSTNFNSNG